jgi:EAL domain-containing protein (putative c-di-GMP-specific phosphodiesterase class I)
VATPDAELERRLWGALEECSLELHYQPVVGLHDATLAAAEALLRWRHRTGLLAAGAFLPHVTDPALACAVSTFTFEEAARQAAIWQRRFPNWIFPVTVNVGAVEFTDELVERIGELRARHALPSGALGVDISEPLLLADVGPTGSRVAALKEVGAQVFVDDFGTTHADRSGAGGGGGAPVVRSTEELLRSLVALERFRIDVLKVDRELVDRCFAGPHAADVVQSLVRVAHLSGFRILAEGVETGEEAETLRALGFDLAQGYYFQRPHGPGHIDRLLHDLADAREAFAAQRSH